MLRIIKVAAKWLSFAVLALLWVIQILQISLGGGMFMLLFTISLAVAGPGNRFLWCMVFGIMVAAMGALGDRLPSFPRVEQHNFWYSLTFFTLMVLVPAGIIWLAQLLAAYRSRKTH